MCTLVNALALLASAGVASAQDEVPFITTPDHVTLAMLEVARVGPADHVIDLGSGDGRIVITAARRFGATGLGVEIVPELVAQSRAHAARAGVADKALFREQDLFATDLSRATVVTMYLLPDVNLQLRPRLLALAPGTRIVSHDWDLGDWVPERTITLDVPDKVIGRDKRSRVHLWTVPARFDGLWCSPGGASLRITQRFDHASAVLQGATVAASTTVPPPLVFDGRIHATRLDVRPPHAGQLSLDVGAQRLQVSRLGSAAIAHDGQSFTRSPDGAACRAI